MRVSVSQPFEALLSQSPNPALQVVIVQAPIAQPETEFGSEHARLHAPQLAVSLRVSASQPFDGSPSQSAKPGSQVYSQRLDVQVAVVWARGAQAIPQPPQWATVRDVSTSQPVDADVSQSAKGAVHIATVQVPFMHDETAFGAMQRLPQVPHEAVLL